MANRSCRDRSALDSVSGRLADVFMAGPPVVQKSQHRRYELRPRSVRNLLCGRRTPDKPNWEGHLPRACRERSPLQASPLLHHISNHKSNTDRKSTRLNSVTNAHLVCRLLLEKKQSQTTNTVIINIHLYTTH